MSRQLLALGDLGLIAWVGPTRGEDKLWYLTGRGARHVGERADFADRTVGPLDRRQALSQNQRHLLEANEVGVQLARWARQATPPDQFGVRSCRNEQSHRFADGAGKGCWLRPDAVVRHALARDPAQPTWPDGTRGSPTPGPTCSAPPTSPPLLPTRSPDQPNTRVETASELLQLRTGYRLDLLASARRHSLVAARM